jgi:hypothetical protein
VLPGLTAARICFSDGAFKPVEACRPYHGYGVYIRWRKPHLQWSLDGNTWTTGYTETLPGPVLWGDFAAWLAFGYSPE